MTETSATAPRILVFTGDGKGKTTAVMGMALRAAGHGLRVRVLQFVKRPPGSGEAASLQALPTVCISQCGRGFIPPPDSPRFAEHRQAACEGLAAVTEEIAAGSWDVVVLDELCVAVAQGLVPEADVLALLEVLPAGIVLAMSGRGATPALIAAADTVTELKCIKHAMDAGRPAQRGVEM
ncbi:MAG: cob(I)yrinic acid a,c-diamide adenosyltransferase [Lentisphaeria bacterium]|nr:cob(I)yrinic acid a,c-diamide adenosyltransferase [Lentisphaeria bacterium]